MSQRRKTNIKQGALADVMSHLADLPKREKDPAAQVGLSEVFRTKEYMTEIRGALKKGYSFEQLAEIFTERCGVEVTPRQMRYHYTREKNLRTKGKKTGTVSAATHASSTAEGTQTEISNSTPVAMGSRRDVP